VGKGTAKGQRKYPDIDYRLVDYLEARSCGTLEITRLHSFTSEKAVSFTVTYMQTLNLRQITRTHETGQWTIVKRQLSNGVGRDVTRDGGDMLITEYVACLYTTERNINPARNRIN
jgi:hypothetical protein